MRVHRSHYVANGEMKDFTMKSRLRKRQQQQHILIKTSREIDCNSFLLVCASLFWKVISDFPVQ